MAVSTIPDEAPPLLDVNDPEHLCARLRWPDGPACPRCRSSEVKRQAADASRSLLLRWRCSACHRDFTVTTGTALQNTRIGLGDWVRAGRAWQSSPGEIRQMLGVSHPTARRIARLLEITEHPAGDERIKALLRLPPDAAEADAEWRRSFLGPEHRRSDPLSGLSRGERQVMGVLDYIARGATVQRVAEASRLSPGHVRRCLKSLERRGFAQIENKHLLIGYGLVKQRIWSLTRTEACNAATVCLPLRQLPPDDPPEAIPAEFWWLFWSGRRADQIDFSDEDDMLTAAETMIGGPDAVARNWALAHLPLAALRQLRTMRGYKTGDNAQALDSMIQARTAAVTSTIDERREAGRGPRSEDRTAP